jgi:hypothetical protein
VRRCCLFAGPIFAILLLAGCGAANNVGIAKSATNEFHQQFNASEDGAIYEATDPEFRKGVDRETFQKMLARIRRKLGVCTEANATSYFYNISTDGSFVELKYTTKCANGALEETFRWHMVNNRAQLYNYDGQSPLLLTD